MQNLGTGTTFLFSWVKKNTEPIISNFYSKQWLRKWLKNEQLKKNVNIIKIEFLKRKTKIHEPEAVIKSCINYIYDKNHQTPKPEKMAIK